MAVERLMVPWTTQILIYTELQNITQEETRTAEVSTLPPYQSKIESGKLEILSTF